MQSARDGSPPCASSAARLDEQRLLLPSSPSGWDRSLQLVRHESALGNMAASSSSQILLTTRPAPSRAPACWLLVRHEQRHRAALEERLGYAAKDHLSQARVHTRAHHDHVRPEKTSLVPKCFGHISVPRG